MKKNLAEQARAILQNYVATQHNGVKNRAAKALDISLPTLNQWLEGKRTPNLENLSPVFERLGIGFSGANLEACQDICFVDAKMVPTVEDATPPVALDYMAAPLVGEAGAGPGYLPQEEIKSWFLVYKYQPAVRYRRNLIAVEIGPSSTSMQPTLNSGDIVLVDREDRDVSQPGHIMLVLDPLDGSGMIKRVSVKDTPTDCQITYYSDNVAQNPPRMYSLKNDFGGDFDRSIVGRVVWAWSDIREK